MIASAAGRSAAIPSWTPDRHRGFPWKFLRVAARWKYLANVRLHEVVRRKLIDLARSSIQSRAMQVSFVNRPDARCKWLSSSVRERETHSRSANFGQEE
jgi:hypothetical protein